jgi:hypothetical protein
MSRFMRAVLIGLAAVFALTMVIVHPWTNHHDPAPSSSAVQITSDLPQATSDYHDSGFVVSPNQLIKDPTKDDSVVVSSATAEHPWIQIECKDKYDYLQQKKHGLKIDTDVPTNPTTLATNRQTFLKFIFPGTIQDGYELQTVIVQHYLQIRTRDGQLLPIFHDSQVYNQRGSRIAGDHVGVLETVNHVHKLGHGYVGIPQVCATHVSASATPHAVG